MNNSSSPKSPFPRLLALMSFLISLSTQLQPAAEFLNQIHPWAAHTVGILGLIGVAGTEALVDVRPHLRKLKPKKAAKALAVVLAGTMIVTTVACDSANLRSGVAAFSQAASEGKEAVSDLKRDGEITDDDAARLTTIFDEAKQSADNYKAEIPTYDVLTEADQWRLLQTAIDEGVRLADRLEQEGILKLKSEKAQKRLRKALKYLRYGTGILRIVQAALPPPEESLEQSPQQ